MFGYVTVNPETLQEEEQKRYQAVYCGLCRQLDNEYGGMGRATLTYDMTFLAMLLSSLYQQDETTGDQRCPVHPMHRRAYVISPATEYAADMNLVLAYYKCVDDWNDDHSIVALGKSKLLQKKAVRAEKRWPRQCEAITGCLGLLSQMEKENELNPDRPANCFGSLMGELFVWQEDQYAASLRRTGAALGRFIYLMDAVNDLGADIKKKRYNPLVAQPDTGFIPMLTMLIGECTEEFEKLPLQRDLRILRNILYSGIWIKLKIKREGVD